MESVSQPSGGPLGQRLAPFVAPGQGQFRTCLTRTVILYMNRRANLDLVAAAVVGPTHCNCGTSHHMAVKSEKNVGGLLAVPKDLPSRSNRVPLIHGLGS